MAELREAIIADVQKRAPESTLETEGDQEARDDALASPEAGEGEGEGEGEGNEGLEFLNDLPEVLGIEPEDFYKLKLRLSEDGEPVPFGEIKDRLQQSAKEQESIAQQRAALDQYAQQVQQYVAQSQQAVAQRTERMRKAEGVMETIRDAYAQLEQSWAEREAKDPGQVALERQRIADRYQQAEREYRDASTEAAAQQQQMFDRWQMDRNARVMQAFPEWSDEKKRGEDFKSIYEYSASIGISPEELAIADHRILAALRDAALGAKVRKDAGSALEKAKPTNMNLRGVRTSKGKVSKAREADLANRALETGKTQDKLAAARAIFENG